MLNLPIYLDNNATTPMDPRVLDAMIPYFTQNFGNAASRNHPFGWKAEEAVDYARGQVAALINADPKEIIFTSGATESNNLAIKGVFEMYAEKGNHVITVETEHKAVLDTCKHIEKAGAEITYLKTNEQGLITIEQVEAAIQPNTRAIYAESLGNPSMLVLDIAAIADVAHAHGLPLIIDNTVPSPFLCNPIAFGADVVVHSATKYLAGHGTTLGGVIVESGKFPWDNGKFPGMTEPSSGYHGVKFYETFGDFGFTMRCRMECLRVYGASLSPMSAWQILQGVETLPLRMERHCSNALAVAEFLQNDPRVAWVNYPGLPNHPQHALVKKQMRGASGLLAFGVKGGLAQGVKFIEAARFMSHLVNIGDTRTLISHPASTTHRQLNEEQQLAAGVGPDMIRISVGLEHIDDILWDIDQALNIASPVSVHGISK